MRKFTPEDDFSYLKGCTLTRVSIDRYQISLLFAEEIQIVLEYGLEYAPAKNSEALRYDIQVGCGAISFHECLEKQIAHIRTDETGVDLEFEGGATIRLLTDDGPYESGHILRPRGMGGCIF
jgi:hypothetical protein